MRLPPHLYLPIIIILLCGIYGMRADINRVNHIPNGDIIMGDKVDTPLIVEGLKRNPQFRDTLSWWYGPWIQGEKVPFYRPLTSLIWWSEYKLFGANGLWGFMTVHFASHFFVLLIALLFLRELLGLKIATFSVGIFAIHEPLLFFGLPSSSYALEMWKDDPEMWSAIACLLALWCFLKFLKKDSRRWLVVSIACFVVGITIKEYVYVLPLLLPLLLWYKRQLSSHWKWLIPFYVISICAFAFRWWALSGWGFRFGTNGSWKQRWLIHVIGGASAARITAGDWAPTSIVCGISSLFWGLTGKSRWWQVGLAIVAALSLWLAGQNIEYPAYYLLIGSRLPWIVALYLFTQCFLIWRFIHNRHRGQWFGWFWVVIAYIPLMTAPITQHALYFTVLGWSIWMSYAIIDLYEMTINLYKSITDNRSTKNSA